MTKAKDFAELQSKGIKQLTKDKYVDAMVRLEFGSVQNAANVWKAVAKGFGQDPAKMPEYGNPDELLKFDYKKYIEKVGQGHKANYGRQWDEANSR